MSTSQKRKREEGINEKERFLERERTFEFLIEQGLHQGHIVCMEGDPTSRKENKLAERANITVIQSYEQLCQSFQSDPSSVCILDDKGNIIFTNKSWNNFASENGGDVSTFYKGYNYLTLCEEASKTEVGTNFATLFASSLRKILEQQILDDFQLTYPCDSPTTKRLYVAKTQMFRVNFTTYIVVIHQLISSEPKIKEEENPSSDQQDSNISTDSGDSK